MNLTPHIARPIIACCISLFSIVHAADPAPAEISSALKRSADWHLSNPSGIDTRDWIIAPLYDGLLRTATATGDAKYLAAVLSFGTQAGWMPAHRTYHADDHAVGHAWLDIYQMDPKQTLRLQPMKARMDHIIANPITEALSFSARPSKPTIEKTDRWTWCDAIYMAPPTLTRLHRATGDAKYLRFLDQEFRYTYDHLYDHDEHLFYRDSSFIPQKTPNGKKVFWSRGNGWVYGGLALVLETLPADHPTRGFYENLFKEMTGAILAAQQADGLWHPSLLDPDQVPIGETSGSGFFVFGLAWGVNHGLLDREKHWPAITRGWAGLMTRVKPDGFVGYVQPVGAAPAPLGPDSIQDYGTGAFLLAGSELLRALGSASATKPADLLAAAEKIVAAQEKTPRAYARMVPERMDDLAWENDKVAFRCYGPALRSSAEDSGIDAWCKKVTYPILDKWYREAMTNKNSYHTDSGEGFDGFHVGNTRGCGGLGLWVDGKLVTADVYQSSAILWTKPDVAEFRTTYQYPIKIGGKPVFERRTTRLRLGSRFSEIRSVFMSGPHSRGAKHIADFPYEIAIGLTAQSADATATIDSARGFISLYGPFPGGSLGTAVLIGPEKILRTQELPATDKEGKNRQLLAFIRPDASGKIDYLSGFAWAGDGEIRDAGQWIEFLNQQSQKMR